MTFFHVRICPSDDPESCEWEFDLNRGRLEERFIECYRMGRDIGIRGKWFGPRDIERMQIWRSGLRAEELTSREDQAIADSGLISFTSVGRPTGVSRHGVEVTSEFIQGRPGYGRAETGASEVASVERDSATREAAHGSVTSEELGNERRVFVVHGRDEQNRKAMFAFLRSIDLDPIEWSEARRATGRPMPYIGDILDRAFSMARAVVVLLTPDDEARLREAFRTEGDPRHETDLTGQARPNVLFEAGMAMGRHPERTILVECGRLRPFTDIAGLHVVRFDSDSTTRQELAHRLEDAGCRINLQGTDWHAAGEFSIQ